MENPLYAFQQNDEIEARSKLILFYDEIGLGPEGFHERLGIFGFQLRQVREIQQLMREAMSGLYQFIIIRRRNRSGQLLKQIASFAYEDGAPPILMISDDTSLQSRLQALRAGVKSYALAPVDLMEIVDRLEHLIEHLNHEPYNILIVENDPETAEFYRTILVDAGMKCRVLRDWNNLLNTVSESRPDVIFLSAFVEEADGGELARVLRLDPANDPVPIIFFSHSESLNEQKYLMSCGGDDILVTPISKQSLLNALANRVHRFRRIRAGITRDSLTGLLNHTNLETQLEVEFSVSQRTNKSLSYALIDIDHFKRINDTYGHGVGDQVLKSLSHLLRQRLRRSDYIGRYGGEEFGVIMPNTSESQAYDVLDQIRTGFSSMKFETTEGDFQVNFSGGLANSEGFDSAQEMLEAADSALYMAKDRGRNNIQLHSLRDRIFTGTSPSDERKAAPKISEILDGPTTKTTPDQDSKPPAAQG